MREWQQSKKLMLLNYPSFFYLPLKGGGRFAEANRVGVTLGLPMTPSLTLPLSGGGKRKRSRVSPPGPMVLTKDSLQTTPT